MTTIVLLVRHAVHDTIESVLSGRSDRAILSLPGIKQARQLARMLAHEQFSGLQSSPRRRALETASRIGTALNLCVQVHDQLDEIDTGDWTGRSFKALDCDPQWHLWNTQRGTAQIPNGESMSQLQTRIVSHLRNVQARHGGGRVVMVSHAEPIRAAILHYRGMALDDYSRIRVDPCSVTTLALQGDAGELISANVRLTDPVAA